MRSADRNELAAAIALDRFWDHLVDPGQAVDADAATDTARLVITLHDSTPATNADPAFVDRLERRLRAQGAAFHTADAKPRVLSAVNLPRMRWAWVAAPAVVAVTLLVLLLASGPADVLRERDVPRGNISAPVVGQSIERVDLGAVTIPFEALPSGDTMVLFSRHTIAAGTVWTLPSADPSHGVMATFFVEGEVTVQIASEVRIRRASGETETVPAGTPFALRAGDVKVAIEGGAESVERYGPERDAVSYSLRISDDVSPADSRAYGDVMVPSGVECRTLGDLSVSAWTAADLGRADISATLSSVVIQPGAEIVVHSDDPVALRFVDDGTLRWEKLDSSGTPITTRPLYFGNGRAIPWSELQPGERIVLRNEGATPVQMTELILQPA